MAAIVVAAGLLVATEPASAHHGGGSTIVVNGCTGVPDSGYGFAFRAACNDHDRCYSRQPHGSGYSGRRSCDRVFRSDMLRYCQRHDHPSAQRLSCRTTAFVYYGGVRALGYSFWIRQAAPALA